MGNPRIFEAHTKAFRGTLAVVGIQACFGSGLWIVKPKGLGNF